MTISSVPEASQGDGFPEAGRAFLTSFYQGTKTDLNDPTAKIEALRKYFIREEMLISVTTEEEELRALEELILEKHGFEV